MSLVRTPNRFFSFLVVLGLLVSASLSVSHRHELTEDQSVISAHGIECHVCSHINSFPVLPASGIDLLEELPPCHEMALTPDFYHIRSLESPSQPRAPPGLLPA